MVFGQRSTLQVRAHILGTATAGIVDNSGIVDSTMRAATPSALLHVPLNALPTLRFAPDALQPVTLFADSTNAVQSQRITVQNTGNTDVRFNVTVTPRYARMVHGTHHPTTRSFLFADRVRVSNRTGVLPARSNTTITVQYNVVQLSFPGVYMADVLITTDGQPVVTVGHSSTSAPAHILPGVPRASQRVLQRAACDTRRSPHRRQRHTVDLAAGVTAHHMGSRPPGGPCGVL